jgi:xanthine dehydrogenase YagR molybdenum-binding subunit
MEMDKPVGTNVLDTVQNGWVGKPLDRVDGRLKVTGGAKYAYEVMQGPATAYGDVVQASIGKGTITAIDTRAAEHSQGVLLVLTHLNAPEQGQGNHREAHPVLTGPQVAYFGEPVALVVAETFEQARAAAYLVRVSYDRAPGNYALRANLNRARPPVVAAGQAQPDSAVGNFDAAFAAAPVQLDEIYTTPPQSQAMMEPHATLALWAGDELTLHTSNQMLSQGRLAVAKTLKMPVDKVRLVSPYIGGGFGAKLWVNADAILAAIAARRLGRPVKVALARRQVFAVTTHRSDTVQRIRLGTDREGRILAVGHDSFSGNLPSEQTYETAAMQTRTLYAGANRLTRHRLSPLDIPVASSMRAPGEAVGLLALESAMDELADRLNLDPIELRVRNEPSEDPERHVPYSSRHLIACLQQGAQHFGWASRNPRAGQVQDGRWLVGMGVAAATRGNGLQRSTATVRLDPEGVATVRMAMTDIGTGTYTILTQIAAEMLGLPPSLVRVEIGDTAFPAAAGSGGSIGAASSGSALFDACDRLRAKLASSAGLDPGTAVFANGRIEGGGQSRALTDLVGPQGVEADGEIQPGENTINFSQQSYGAHFAEVGVDADTGEIRVRRMLGVFAAGRILNAKTARSQAIGGMVFGIGAALEEALVMDARSGLYVNHDLAEYHVPVHADVPEIEAIFVAELDDESNPLKSKGVGELGICGAGAALANAVHNACGARIRDFPITLDKLLSALPTQS